MSFIYSICRQLPTFRHTGTTFSFATVSSHRHRGKPFITNRRCHVIQRFTDRQPALPRRSLRPTSIFHHTSTQLQDPHGSLIPHSYVHIVRLNLHHLRHPLHRLSVAIRRNPLPEPGLGDLLCRQEPLVVSAIWQTSDTEGGWVR